MTDDEKYLVERGWAKNPDIQVFQWRDPQNLLSHYSFKNALKIQRRRDEEGK